MRAEIQQVRVESLTCLGEGFVMHHANNSKQIRQTQDVKTGASQQQVQGDSFSTIHYAAGVSRVNKVDRSNLTCLAEGLVVHHANDLEQSGQTQDIKAAASQQQVQGQ